MGCFPINSFQFMCLIVATRYDLMGTFQLIKIECVSAFINKHAFMPLLSGGAFTTVPPLLMRRINKLTGKGSETNSAGRSISSTA